MKNGALPQRLIACLFVCGFFLPLAGADEEIYQRVEIATPYIEMHTGPGAAYPVFHVVERGEAVEVLKRKNEWFKIRTGRDKQGWVSRAQMEQTLNPDGSRVRFAEFTRDDFNQRRWEGGILAGDFGGAAVISAYGAYTFTANLSVETSLSNALGDVSSSVFFNVNIVNQPFPDWDYSPFMTLGTGIIRTEPGSTLVVTEDRTDELLHAGLGLRTFIGKRFILRAEYKKYVVITSRDENDDIEEWKIGFSVFF